MLKCPKSFVELVSFIKRQGSLPSAFHLLVLAVVPMCLARRLIEWWGVSGVSRFVGMDFLAEKFSPWLML